MSGVAAFWSRSDEPASPNVLPAMVQAMRSRGPDGTSVWRRGSVAVGHLSFISTREAACERQPVESAAGVVVALDGRLDNRADLVAALAGAVGATDGDAAFVLAAYERWGVDAFARLIGDFAIVISDRRTDRLICARDVMGVRPLCYATGRRGELVVASELRGVLASGVVDDSVNEVRALEHLIDRGQHRGETLYGSILRLPPAHVLVATRSRVELKQYWDFRAVSRLRYRDAREYADHARSLVGQVVRAQSRSAGRVGVLLSGGVDSSVVAAIASAEGISCDALTVGFPDDPRDETPYAAAVAAAAGLPLHVVPYAAAAAHWYQDQTRAYRDLPDYPNGAMLDAARTAAASRGVTVLLTGVGGDEWFTGSPYRYADWLRSGALPRMAGGLASDSRVRGWRRAGRDALLCGVWPNLPRVVRASIKRVHGRRDRAPEWIDADAASRNDLLERVAVRVQARPGETFAHADTRLIGGSGFQVHSEEMEDRAATRAGVEQRHPLYDRRIIEFAFALPEEQRWHGASGKVVLRNAARGLLPASISDRRDKAEFSDTYTEALAGWTGDGFPHLTERGWINGPAVEVMQRHLHQWRASGDTRYFGLLGPAWMLRALECWLTHLQN